MSPGKSYPCWRCGKRYTDTEQMSYSSWTHQRYCLDFEACDRRFNRLPADQRAERRKVRRVAGRAK